MHNHTHQILDAVAPQPAWIKSVFRGLNRRMVEAQIWPYQTGEMCTPEQRNNIFLLVDQVIAFEIPGDVVEFGCYEGHTARVIAAVLDHNDSHRAFHVYDHFQFDMAGSDDVRERFERNFGRHHLPLPIIHEGPFQRTVPAQLPERIAFAHIDCGTGALPEYHAQQIDRLLEAIYPRMSEGAIGVLMDYHD